MPRALPNSLAAWTAAQSLQRHKLKERSGSVIEVDSPTHPPNRQAVATERSLSPLRKPPQARRVKRSIMVHPQGWNLRTGPPVGKLGSCCSIQTKIKLESAAALNSGLVASSSYLPDCPVKLCGPPAASHSHLILQINSPALGGIIRAGRLHRGALS